ncbi:hypothetical protein [Pseudomonas sp. P9_31]|uniref:hypothetical protein n=1 Tax=Pseudomonas sp. P9_31 TaxID=3043448 RepID=UPI002A371851|nr:hypothetical protein [Pseudomonas sp. P9_31]WPN56316.1 hypothetical protein QMK51_19470 [Pseudomonas sp. P9_31]
MPDDYSLSDVLERLFENQQALEAAILDYISHGLSDEEKEEFRTYPQLNHRWDKVILTDPTEPSNAYEVS